MNVRPAAVEDLPAIVAINNEAVANGFAHFGVRPWTLREAREAFDGRRPRHLWLVAEDGGVLGYCKAGFWKTRGGYDWTVELGVYVDASARGRGVGRALYERFLPDLEAAGVRHVVAGIALPNPASVALHERFGFERVALFPRQGWKLGAWHDVGYWTLLFGGDEPPPG